MRVQPAHGDLHSVPLSPPSTDVKVAVLLNANARRVTEKVIRKLKHVVPEADLFISRSELDARRIAQTVIERGYPAVFCGGGDGTFMGFANEILRQVEVRGRYLPIQPPRFGILKLGTGNGMGALVNASPMKGDKFLEDVLRARAGEVPGYKRLDLLTVDGKRTQFAGVGVDGKILNDYIWVKDRFAKGPFQKMASGGAGYFGAVAFRTVPYFLAQGTWTEAEAVNTGSRPALRLDAEGKVVGEVAPGEVLYRGRLMMAAAATIPYYGFKFRMFPFAGRNRGMMQLRIGVVSTTSVLANLPKLWKGAWFPHERILDFAAEDVSFTFAKPMPFQVGGDAAGYRSEIRYQMAPEQLELLDFHAVVN
jgi:diacylglycerol kinase family enzyme